MASQGRDVIYVINKFANFATFSWRNHSRLVLPYNIPVEIDYTDDPDLLSNLLQCPELQVCTKKELAEYMARVKANARKIEIEGNEKIQKDSETDKLIGED